MNDKMWYEDIEAMDIDDRQMEILEKSRVMESERYLRSIPEVRDNVTDSQIIEYSKKHTKEFVQFLQELQKTEASENNRTYDLIDLLEHCSARALVEGKIKDNPFRFRKLDPKMMYNDVYFNTALMITTYKPKTTIKPLMYNLSFLEGLKNTLITKRQLQQIYLSVIQALEKEEKLEETSLTPDMKRMAKDYMEKQGKVLKRKEKENVYSKEFISFGLADIPDAQHFRRAKSGLFGFGGVLQSKASGGIFSAEYKPNQRGNISDWETYCLEQMPTSHRDTLKFGMIFSLSPNARVLTIDSLEDVLDAIEKYPLKEQSIGDDSEIKGCMEKFLNPSYCRQKNGFIDYEAMSKDYDVLNITKNGQEALDYTIREREDADYTATIYTGYYSDYARWDIPTLLVLNTEVIQNVKEYVADEEELKVIAETTRCQDECEEWEDEGEEWENQEHLDTPTR